MKRVLITGASSYVGTNVRQHLEQYPDNFIVDSLSVRDDKWREKDFSTYDAIYHCAGLAHSEVGNVSDEVKAKYYAVNTDLTINIAKKAKAEGVKQFIFMSSAIVYGDSAPIGKEKIITNDTPRMPANFYGDSKVQAENGLMELADDSFKVVILRCPMIYGKGSKGNFPVLEKMALKLPVFPKVENHRSMLYIKNLAEFVRLMIENEESGVFWPCNREWSNTSELVRMIADAHGKKIVMIPGTSMALKAMAKVTGYVNKAFGNLAYEEGLGDYKENYRLYGLEDSIRELA